ncbi:MAG: phenylacetate-CoA oxygenase subunit PaaC [Actinomycetota bacterium]|nr:phenylacetate-CoA oxygenase subunit PaaC [Actinomycetota bacterium]
MTSPVLPADVASYALRLGDDALVLAQRLAEWSAKAPDLEEDIALTNIGLDLLGQARSLLQYAGELEGAARTEDELAYLRQEREFTNCQLVEHPNGDFATTIARQLCFSTYQRALYAGLTASADETIAAVAAKGVKETTYHCDHAEQWTLRLGDGTAESSRRMQSALEQVWPYVAELFGADELTDRLAAAQVAVDPASLRPAWDARIDEVLAEAGLRRPVVGAKPGGGRRGVHTEPFGYLLAEMQHLHRSYPGATW